jgi:ectoine hydroxylase-related dioxygenase (phytanoyl-CoA dioxygenase family)
MSASLSASHRQQFDRDGFLFPIRVLDDGEVARYLAKYNDYTAHNSEKLAGLAPKDRFHVLAETHFVLKWACDIASHPRVLDAVESLIGPNILALSSAWFSKMPRDKAFVSWHQDGTYWNLSAPTVVTAWVALTPATAANGCMRVVAGTHKQPMMPQRETYAADNVLSRGQEIAVEVNEADAIDLVLEPGEMSLHHIWIVHGSRANASEIPRIGLAIRYVSPEVKQDSPFKPLALLVRGRDDHGHFELLDPPTTDTPREPDAQEQIITRIRAGILRGAKSV